ncbi:serine-type D-Ala-D-Ala carboxypeptidase [Flaviaesturariibacter amylovorans]|uniref:Serine-type D-Ala-D-Ala carboxypeptidase n=2 Tax=Flaviaesturariibacter amylovorans TaxID=1084520 RepID=A0ABP8GYD9_9BACT
MLAGIASLYVEEAGSGNVVFSQNARTGLAPASTQKVITAATAYELLGRDFRYRTDFYLAKGPSMRSQNPRDSFHFLVVKPSGDPTLGSWRWKFTTESAVQARLVDALRKSGARSIQDVRIDTVGWQGESIPGGWTWQDVGNYFGAAAHAVNWHENQYDLVLRSKGRGLGELAEFVETRPKIPGFALTSFVRVAAKGTGDRTNIYYGTRPSAIGYPLEARGTIPADAEAFTVTGSFPDPWVPFYSALWDTLRAAQLSPAALNVYAPAAAMAHQGLPQRLAHSEYSPSLDSMVFFFLRRSVNLYGEAFTRRIALQAGRQALTDEGTEVMRGFWKERGASVAELHLMDGSGLSPENRVSTRAQVQVLQYARSRPWFAGYFQAFPLYNEMKMKSGTISRVKGFCGYHKARDGKEYVFSFIVNNYNGSASAIVQKMYAVLNELK